MGKGRHRKEKGLAKAMQKMNDRARNKARSPKPLATTVKLQQRAELISSWKMLMDSFGCSVSWPECISRCSAAGASAYFRSSEGGLNGIHSPLMFRGVDGE